MPDSNNNITTGSPVGDVETRLEEGEQSKIILLLKRGVKKNGAWELFGGGSKGSSGSEAVKYFSLQNEGIPNPTFNIGPIRQLETNI